MCAKFYLMGYHRVNWFKSELCYAIFYPNCIVFDIIGQKDLKEKIKQIKTQKEVKHADIFIKPLLVNKELKNFGQSIGRLSETDVFELNKKNKLIYYNKIKKMTYHPVRIDISCESCISKSGILIIKSDKSNITLYHDYNEKTLLEVKESSGIS